MITSSNGNIFRVTGPLCGVFTGHRGIPLTKASDADLLCFRWSAPWINAWVNNRGASDLRRRLAHYDAIVNDYGLNFLYHCPGVFNGTHIKWKITNLFILDFLTMLNGDISVQPNVKYVNYSSLKNAVMLPLHEMCIVRLIAVLYDKAYYLTLSL